jgi:hypothetical protein
MAQKQVAKGKEWQLEIRKVKDRWTVGTPDGKLHHGEKPAGGKPGREPDSVCWTLAGDPRSKVSAHFQFTDPDLFTGYTGVRDLTRDLTAQIKKPGGTLRLKLKRSACRRRNPRYYAVWIQDPSLKGGGQFAVGASGNPPPELEVGP